MAKPRTWTPKPPVKTKAEWDKIKFENSLGPQIGGLIHDAVAIVVAEVKSGKVMEQGDELHDVRERIEHWLSVLYEIAEQKKEQILKDQEPKPLTKQDVINASKMGEQVLKTEEIHQEQEIDAVNDELNKEAEENKNIPF
jgi:hypothetical protein